MRGRRRLIALLAAGGLVVALAGRVGVATAQPDATTLARSVIAGGGGASAGTQITLAGTVGQPVAGVATGSVTTLGAGFWTGGIVIAGQKIYLPFVMKP